MKFDRNIKVGIVSSIIASSLFLLLLEPVLRGITRLIFGAGAWLFSAYTDRLFEQAALLTPPDPGLYLLLLLFGGIVGFAVGVTSDRISLWRELRGRAPRKDEESPLGRAKRFPWPLLVADALVLFVTTILLYSTFFQMRVISSFKQHMTAISPFISDDQSKRLYSRWTQMKSEADYKHLYDDLRQIAVSNNVRLPDNILFSYKNL